MTGYIDWRRVPKKAMVRLVGKKGLRHYSYRGKTITWSGSESYEAQSFLNRLVANRAAKQIPSQRLHVIPKARLPKAKRLRVG